MKNTEDQKYEEQRILLLIQDDKEIDIETGATVEKKKTLTLNEYKQCCHNTLINAS